MSEWTLAAAVAWSLALYGWTVRLQAQLRREKRHGQTLKTERDELRRAMAAAKPTGQDD